MGAIEQQIADAVSHAIEPLAKKVDALCAIEYKRMMNKTEAAEYMGLTLHIFNRMTEKRGFPESACGLWARGWLDDWMKNK